MKYKIGDKVKIKTWEEMEKEAVLIGYNYINLENSSFGFIREMEKGLEQINKDRILTITKIEKHSPLVEVYRVKELGYGWADEMIKCLVEKVPNPTLNRYEILDLRGYK